MSATMNRRDMLKLFGYGVAGAMALDPEKLLWVPGEKTIFLPAVTTLQDRELVESIWTLTLRLEDLHELSELKKNFLGTELERMEQQARLKHGALGTLMISGEKAFHSEWKEVGRSGSDVTYTSRIATRATKP